MSMSLPVLLLFAVSTAILPLAGNFPEPVKVTVKEGDQVLLSCDASAVINKDTKVDLMSMRWTNRDQYVCAFDKGKFHAIPGYLNRTEMFRQEGRDAHFLLLINDTVFSDGGEYTCFMQESGKTGVEVTTIHLIVQGHDKSVSVVIGGTLNISLPAKDDVTLRFSPASGSTLPPIECVVQQSALRPDCAYKSRATLPEGDHVLQLSQITFMDEGNFTVTSLSTGSVFNTVELSVKGQSVNQTLVEGSDLFLRLLVDPVLVEFQSGPGSSAALRLCEVVNGVVIHPAEHYKQRLAVRNGTLVLRMLTAEDEGEYIMKEKRSGRAAQFLSLYKVRLGRNNLEWCWMLLLPILLLSLSFAYKHLRKRRMEREKKKMEQKIDEGLPLNETKPPLDNGVEIV